MPDDFAFQVFIVASTYGVNRVYGKPFQDPCKFDIS